jgi:hypothetical protein
MKMIKIMFYGYAFKKTFVDNIEVIVKNMLQGKEL